MRRSRMKETIMKVVVIGGTGLIGSKLVAKLNEHGHEAVPAAPNTGVNTLTGEGLAEVLTGASVVIDVSNSPSFADDAVMAFFRTSTTNLLKAQESLIKDSGIPYSIVHATQFFEFMKGIAEAATDGDTVRLAPVKIRPIFSDDVAAAVGRTAVGTPVGGVVEVAGPEEFQLDE